jgi:signal transduction histidine kinase
MSDPDGRLLTTTRRRLFVGTLALVALLVIGTGAAAALVALRALDDDVDRALTATVDAAGTTIREGLPSTREGETDEAIPAVSDTFLLILDPAGAVVANPSRIGVGGLPDGLAVGAARAGGRDLRTITAGGIEMRLLTVAVRSQDQAGVIGYVQGAFVLTLHDEQSRSIVSAILLVGAAALAAAAAITLIVTGRAISPIRRAFTAQRRFVASASHELRTPAALIRANADVIEREGLSAPAGKPLVADIIAESDRLAQLVGDLLEMASFDATGLAIDPQPVDLAEVADATAREAQALAAGRGVRVVARVDPSSATLVGGDRNRLVQLLLILLDNAFDHSPPGGTVTIDVRRADRNVELSVSDAGPGILASDRDRIFEPFTRLPGWRRDRAGGTGLGLSIARRIVTAHRGTIRVSDTGAGGGATLVVTIPAMAAGS